MFYEKLAQLCSKKGMSVARFAQELNLSNATATKWKHGVKPRYNTLYQIAQYFGVDVEYLADEQYLDYDEWLGEVKGLTRVPLVTLDDLDTKIAPTEKADALDEEFYSLARQLTPGQMQRVKDFMRGVLS